MEEGKKVMGDLMKSEEAKEMLDISKVSKMKSTWNEKGEELTEKGKEFVEKGIEQAQKASKEKKEKEKKGKKGKHHHHKHEEVERVGVEW